MAKIKKTVNLSNVFIDPVELEGVNINIQEINKDDTNQYDLITILNEFAGVEGISISISQAEDIPSAE